MKVSFATKTPLINCVIEIEDDQGGRVAVQAMDLVADVACLLLRESPELYKSFVRKIGAEVLLVRSEVGGVE